MRKFNEREKEIIKFLTTIEIGNFEFFSFHLQNFFFKKENNQALYVDTENEVAYLYIKKEIFTDLPKRKDEQFFFLELLALMQYLNENRFIQIFPHERFKEFKIRIIKDSFELKEDSENNKIYLGSEGYYVLYPTYPNVSKIFDKTNSDIYIPLNLDKGLYDSIVYYFFGLVLVSEELKHLAENNFETDEEKRFRKNYCLTWAGIIVAFLVGIFGLFNPFTSTVKIEESQYKQAIQQVDELKDQLKTYESKIDSLKEQINNNAQTKNSPL